MNRLANYLSKMTRWQTFQVGTFMAFLNELVTCVTRFLFGSKASVHTAFLASFTFGFRIHHGYIGLLFLLIAPLLRKGGWRRALLIFGIGLLFSDLAHHFAVLWPFTGSPEFFFRYPR